MEAGILKVRAESRFPWQQLAVKLNSMWQRGHLPFQTCLWSFCVLYFGIKACVPWQGSAGLSVTLKGVYCLLGIRIAERSQTSAVVTKEGCYSLPLFPPVIHKSHYASKQLKMKDYFCLCFPQPIAFAEIPMQTNPRRQIQWKATIHLFLALFSPIIFGKQAKHGKQL